MQDYFGLSRRCATCQRWEGERIADRAAGRVHTPRHAAAGRCRSPESWWAGRLRQGESTCCFWQPWELVRTEVAGRIRFRVVMLGPPMAHPEYPKLPPI